MAKKIRKKIFHQPTVHEVFYCLSEASAWITLLNQQKPSKPYVAFLSWLTERQFFEGSDEKLSIKKLAADFNISPAKVTAWIFSIYDDIHTLNEERPELFCTDGFKTTFHMKNYDNYCSFTLALPVLPREFEKVTFHFVKAKVGIDIFWVKEIEHSIINGSSDISITLKSGFVNKFREYALDKAEFQGWIDWRDKYEKYDFEIDKELKSPLSRLIGFSCELLKWSNCLFILPAMGW